MMLTLESLRDRVLQADMTLRIATIVAFLATIIRAGDKPLPLKFLGTEGLTREYSFFYSSSSIETGGGKRKDQKRRTTMKIVERTLSVDQDGTLDMEADFEKPVTYLFSKRQPASVFPSLSFKMSPAGTLRDVKAVNPFDVMPGTPLPPYKEYMGLVEFPKGPVSAGDSWQYETKVLLPFSVHQNALVTATFTGMGEYKGKTCALIETRYKTAVFQAPSPLGFFVTGTAQRRSESCFDAASGEILRTKGETTYSVVSVRAAPLSAGGTAPPVSMYLEDTFTTSFLRKKVE